MELKYLLLIMALLYLLPELFRKKPKKYEYPDIPVKTPRPVIMQPMPQYSYEVRNPVVPIPVAMPAAVNVPATVSKEATPWEGRLNSTIIQNGYIFSEILQPPRAYRPITPRHMSPSRQKN